MKKSFFTILFICLHFIGFSQLLSPTEFLHNYGNQVTYYHQVEDYFNHLVANSKKIQRIKYGQTNQERNLNAYFISSPENLKILDNIRKNHLYEIGMFPNKPNNAKDKAIVWLSFNVHGNEFGALESALQVAFQLLNDSNSDIDKWLQETVVILDPCLNPDGFSRYSNWLRNVSSKKTHPNLYDREHMEPWPSGRQNHYVYDLNRDWAWQTQIETQQRMDLYHEWMPEMHLDVHEMDFNETYFFPPAAEPYHEQITDFQRDFHKKIGEVTSKEFDKKGWSYYTGERFDLFYPSYGDTYPCYNGAIGMTYEQGGISAGRAIGLKNGEVLTIQDRINHHTLAILNAVSLAYEQREILIKNFRKYFKESRTNPKGNYKTYIVKDNPKNIELLKLLNRNRIEANFADETFKTKGFHYQSNADKSFTIEPNDLVIQVDQVKSVLTQILFEPNPKLSDSLSYDITAWAMPYAYGVESYALKNKFTGKTKNKITTKELHQSAKAFAYYIPWNNRTSIRVLSRLHQNNIQVRYAKKKAIFGTTTINLGGLIVLKGDNQKVQNFDEVVKNLIKEKQDYETLETGLSSNGVDLGGENFPLLKMPRILLFGGKEVSNVDFGQVWFYLDNMIEFPLSIVEVEQFNRIRLDDFNTIILPEGNYNFSEEQQLKLDDFVTKGGKIIAISEALSVFEDREGYNLASFATDDEKEKAKKNIEEKALVDRFYNYESSERRDISTNVPGAIIENVIDKTHPLSFGLGENYFSLKTNNKSFRLLKNAQNIMYVPKKFKSFGFIGNQLKNSLEETVSFAIDYKGNGKVIYMIDNPLFRGFWENGNLLFGNALFLVE